MATCSSATATEPPLRVRDAQDGDACAIASIYAHEVLHGTATYEVVPPDACTLLARLRSGRGAGHPWRVAVADGRVVGFAYASAFRSRAGYHWTVEDSVYVSPDARGRGVGQRLLEDLVAQCTALGFRRMIAVVGDESNRASIAMHARAGFRVAGRFPGVGRKHGRWLTGVQMQRALGEGSNSAPFAEPEACA